jgi:poly-gamma-glutamate biosynthesis protein PgsC/CapC
MSFGLGIVIGFLFFEITGLTAGGIIVPGYLALYINEPGRILITLIIGLLAFVIVTYLARFLIIFGRRRFLMMILTGFLIRAFFNNLHNFFPDPGIELQAIGYIIPGLIANEFARQGVIKTILSMIIVSTLVYFILNIIYF